MKTYLFTFIVALVLTVICGRLFIPILGKIKARQTILKYVETHKEKNGTPTMGGLFFIIPSIICFYVFGGNGRLATVSVVIGAAYMLVGFIDDFLKIKLKRNEGLKPFQKIAFQTAIALVAGVFVFTNNITYFNLPFLGGKLELGWWSIPLVALIFVAVTNCVNLTDGLDGLAGSVSAVYLFSLVVLICLQTKDFNGFYPIVEEYKNLSLLSTSLIGGILGFLVYNVNKAKVFMGDTGSLSLGGFIASISIFSSNSLFIPIIGIMFVASGISVIVQVLYYKKTKKRVFLMAPLHHHYQLKGFTESKISFYYALITLLCGVLSMFTYIGG